MCVVHAALVGPRLTYSYSYSTGDGFVVPESIDVGRTVITPSIPAATAECEVIFGSRGRGAGVEGAHVGDALRRQGVPYATAAARDGERRERGGILIVMASYGAKRSNLDHVTCAFLVLLVLLLL
jgi:hypothetical protein